MFSLNTLGSELDSRGYTQSSIATIRLWTRCLIVHETHGGIGFQSAADCKNAPPPQDGSCDIVDEC